MSDKLDWSPEEINNLAMELNNIGAHYRNAVACIFNMFTYKLSYYWTGKNYNKVAEYVNAHYEDFNGISIDLANIIPRAINVIASNQAEDGLGTIQTFDYIIEGEGDRTIELKKIELTPENTDGTITLTEDVVKQYIDGTSEPSLEFYKEVMLEYIKEYRNKFEEFANISIYNAALQKAFFVVDVAQGYSSCAINRIIHEVHLMANLELGNISETDVETQKVSVFTLDEQCDVTRNAAKAEKNVSSSEKQAGPENIASEFVSSKANTNNNAVETTAVSVNNSASEFIDSKSNQTKTTTVTGQEYNGES